jgi:hypothetical protein
MSQIGQVLVEVRAGGVVPAVDRMGVVGMAAPAGLIRYREWRPIKPRHGPWRSLRPERARGVRAADASVFLYAFGQPELDGRTFGANRWRRARRSWRAYCARPAPACASRTSPRTPARSFFRHACEMGLEGIVSKRLGSRYRSGRSPHWLKFKN